MKLISPSAEVWPQHDITTHIARCARVCYKPTPSHNSAPFSPQPSLAEPTTKDVSLVQRLIDSKHLSMLRHSTHYFHIPKNSPDTPNRQYIMKELFNRAVPFGGLAKSRKEGTFYAVNGHTYHELKPSLKNLIEPFRVHENDFFGTDDRHEFWPISYLEAYRTTVCMITQISTSRELNRTSPNNISEQSTRYVNFGKKGGITICKPHWYDQASWLRKFLARTAWRIQEAMYYTALWSGMRPEDARGFLPLDTATQVVYTYTNRQWRHIFDLRVRQTTGKAHPNAIQVCSLAKQAIEQRMHMFRDNYHL